MWNTDRLGAEEGGRCCAVFAVKADARPPPHICGWTARSTARLRIHQD